MVYSPETELSARSQEVVLLIRDLALRALCLAELEAMHLVPTVPSAALELLPAHTIVIADLDDADLILPLQSAFHLIGISRKEHSLPPLLTERCKTLLHRPFAIESFSAALRASEVPPRHTALPDFASYKQRRMTVKRIRTASPSPIPHPSGRSILVGNAEITLTPGEMTVFLALFRAGGEAVSRETLSALLHSGKDSNLLDVHICAIRKKLSPYQMDSLIHTVRGIGYCLLKQDGQR